MNENTTTVSALATKEQAGHYFALTYGGISPDYKPSGSFTYRKVGAGWRVSHLDYTVARDLEGQYPERVFKQLQPTLKEAQRFAEQVVRGLDRNVSRRRELALAGARPVAPAPRPAPAAPRSTDVFYTLSDGTRGSYRASTANLADAILITEAQLVDDALADGEFREFTITKAEVVA